MNLVPSKARLPVTAASHVCLPKVRSLDRITRQQRQSQPYKLIVKSSENKSNQETVQEVEKSQDESPVQEREKGQEGATMDPSLSTEAEVGPVGQFISWSVLVVLFAASIFFTFSRQFLPDLVPLDPNDFSP